MARQITVEILADAKKMARSLDDAGRQTRSFTDKVAAAGTKMTAFVSVPVIGFLGAATKAAIEDEAAQSKLAKTLENTTGASEKQVAQVEKYIVQAMKASTFTDDELRPAFARLVTSTKNAEEANKLLATAMDISAATGKPLQTITDAMAKAHDGQTGALSKLGIQVTDAEGKTKSFDQIMADANQTFGGQAQEAANTTAGKMQTLGRDMGELTEEIGKDLLPAFEKLTGFFTDTLVPGLDKLSGDNGALALVGLALTGPLLTAVSRVKEAVYGLSGAFTFLMAHPGVAALAAMATQLPRIIGDVEHLQRTTEQKGFLGGLRELVFGKAGGGGHMPFSARDVLGSLRIPGFQTGGVVPGTPGSPRLAMVHGGEQILPLSRAGHGGGGNVYHLTVVSIDPTSAAEATVRAIDEWESRNGSRYARA